MKLLSHFKTHLKFISNYLLHLSRLMGKPTICIGENKDADQLRGNREANQRFCFRYTDSTIPLLSKTKISSLFCACTAQFVSDLFGNHIVGFPTRWLIYVSSCKASNNFQLSLVKLCQQNLRPGFRCKKIVIIIIICNSHCNNYKQFS